MTLLKCCWKPLNIIRKRPILDVAAALDPPLIVLKKAAFDCNLNNRKHGNLVDLVYLVLSLFFSLLHLR